MRVKRPVLVAVSALALVVTGCDWTTYRGDAPRDGFNSSETAISAANVSHLATAFTGPLAGIPESSPVEANRVVYVEGGSKLEAFDASGTTNCSGTPKVCSPLWTAQLPTLASSTPAVANGVVYISSGDLYAFDAAGNTNCSGTPKVCSPLWRGVAQGRNSSPNVVNGVVYVGVAAGGVDLVAFDAAGNTNCSGTPKVCSPLWTGVPSPYDGNGASDTSPAYANGVIYIGGDYANGSNVHNLYAFDAAGNTNCSGTPKVCSQLWSGPISGTATGSPAVANGDVYITNTNLNSTNTNTLYAFDAAGITTCSGTPKVCTPLWTAQGYGGVAVANGTLYINTFSSSFVYGISAFDASGNTNCSGTPKVCTPVRTARASNYFSPVGSPIVANGVLYSTSGGNNLGQGLYAFSASGTKNCSGTPMVCSPLFTYPTRSLVFGDAAIANGTVYIADGDFFSSEHSLFVLRLHCARSPHPGSRCGAAQ
jgi:outer membrane protein assembly factor BamB